MLVHICCSVDSHYFLSELQKVYPDEKLVGYFYNPNIHPKAEHDLRYYDVKRSCEMLGIELFLGEYDEAKWCEGVVGLEDEPEKGERCVKCFDIRLVKSAKKAYELGERRFTTTLLSSPMKEQQRLFIEGDRIAQDHGLEFIKIDVRSKGGVQRQNALAKKDNLYRQNYCGCKFALAKQRDKQQKVSLEMMSDISQKAQEQQLGGIQERMHTFGLRDDLDAKNRGYILAQRRFLVYRVLKARLLDSQNQIIPSYILSYSHSKKRTKISEIIWAKPELSLPKNLLDQYLKSDIFLGFCMQDSAIFMPLSALNFLLDKEFKNISELKNTPMSLDEECELRKIVSGDHSQNPIIIIDNVFDGEVSYEIESIFQEENIFRVVPLM